MPADWLKSSLFFVCLPLSLQQSVYSRWPSCPVISINSFIGSTNNNADGKYFTSASSEIQIRKKTEICSLKLCRPQSPLWLCSGLDSARTVFDNKSSLVDNDALLGPEWKFSSLRELSLSAHSLGCVVACSVAGRWNMNAGDTFRPRCAAPRRAASTSL